VKNDPLVNEKIKEKKPFFIFLENISFVSDMGFIKHFFFVTYSEAKLERFV
jgi:hypothetical protein